MFLDVNKDLNGKLRNHEHSYVQLRAEAGGGVGRFDDGCVE